MLYRNNTKKLSFLFVFVKTPNILLHFDKYQQIINRLPLFKNLRIPIENEIIVNELLFVFCGRLWFLSVDRNRASRNLAATKPQSIATEIATEY